MENKNYSIVLFSVMFLIIGVFVGWLICSNKQPAANMPNNMHMMGNGQIMSNNMMGMSDTMEGMMAGLQGKTGDAFEKVFLEEMIVHHQGAVEMASMVLASSKRPELIKLANEIISAQTKEIEMMREWQKTWFK